MLIEDMAQLFLQSSIVTRTLNQNEAWMRISTLRECQPHVRLQQSPTFHCVPAQSDPFSLHLNHLHSPFHRPLQLIPNLVVVVKT